MFTVPEELPKNIHLSATKDNISASWDPLPNDLDVWNSNKSQYKYILNETFPFPNLSPYSEILKLGNVSHVTIPSLRATQWYEFKVAAITDTGDGNFSESLCIRTKEAGL